GQSVEALIVRPVLWFVHPRQPQPHPSLRETGRTSGDTALPAPLSGRRLARSCGDLLHRLLAGTLALAVTGGDPSLDGALGDHKCLCRRGCIWPARVSRRGTEGSKQLPGQPSSSG